MPNRKCLSRRNILRSGSIFIVGGLASSLVACDVPQSGNEDVEAGKDDALNNSSQNSNGHDHEHQRDKATKQSVAYQNKPRGNQKCSGCIHFIPSEKACHKVRGQISPEGWCGLWTANG